MTRLLGPPGTEQDHFSFALLDARAGACRWRAGRELTGGFRPRRLWLSDRGWLVILTHSWMTTGLVAVS
ncbi:hypothetical protein KDM41_19010, partial [bacterium]|nr:hypothetical protein [bacterium]